MTAAGDLSNLTCAITTELRSRGQNHDGLLPVQR
jgi:hypothetical protein